jgi:hypothetical protein
MPYLVWGEELFFDTTKVEANASMESRIPRFATPQNRGKNTTVLSSMTLEGMGPSLAVEGATTAKVFETSTGSRFWGQRWVRVRW